LGSRASSGKYDVVVVGGGPTGMVLGHLLQQYGVQHLVVEKRASPTTHPQAHFINARTMEILQTHMPDVFQALMRDKPPLRNWR
jgi:2-polyprenyl-6-methoxyphenol hydroxylase-like FAD-dependent oxidoreductase